MSLLSALGSVSLPTAHPALRRTYNETATGIGPESFGYFDAAGNAKGWNYVSPGRREFCECSTCARERRTSAASSRRAGCQTTSTASSLALQGERVPVREGDSTLLISWNSYIQRPETVESLFYGWRLTGQQMFRDMAWDAFLHMK